MMVICIFRSLLLALQKSDFYVMMDILKHRYLFGHNIKKITFLFVFVAFIFGKALAQSQYAPLNDDYYHLIDRYEILRGRFTEDFHVAIKPFQRQAIVNLIDSIEADRMTPLTDQDFFNFEYLRNDSWEWSSKRTAESQKRFLKRFYQKPTDFFALQNKNVDLHLSPVTSVIIGQESSSKNFLWLTTRGVEMRGLIGKKLGFYTYVSDTQGAFAQYVNDYTRELVAIRGNQPQPFVILGESWTKLIKPNGSDFISARGYLSFNPLKQINLQFGHDKHFFGSGFRSMLLSDAAAPYLFLKMTTQLGRFQYVNLWCGMLDDQNIKTKDQTTKKKYAAVHHLSINLSKNINIGIFEAEIFSRPGGSFDVNYLNPIIFYRYVESYLGSGDNALLGFDFRWNFLKRFGFYSQFMVDEFKTSDYFNEPGSWAKKFGFQTGLKYVNAFGIKNLDLQGEFNLARPYTYSHEAGGENYVHLNVPLAHPMGANFREFVGILRYQPTRKLTLYGTLQRATKGLDFDGQNWGGNIMKDYETRIRDTGNFIGQGGTVTTTFADLRTSYMLRHNLLIDARFLVRRQDSNVESLRQNTTLTSFGIRLNIPYRQQVF